MAENPDVKKTPVDKTETDKRPKPPPPPAKKKSSGGDFGTTDSNFARQIT